MNQIGDAERVMRDVARHSARFGARNSFRFNAEISTAPAFFPAAILRELMRNEFRAPIDAVRRFGCESGFRIIFNLRSTFDSLPESLSG